MPPRLFVASALAAALLSTAAVPRLARAADSTPDSLTLELPRDDHPIHILDRGRVFKAVGALVVVSLFDGGITEEGIESTSSFAVSTSHVGEHFGNPVYLAPVLGALFLGGHVSGHPGVSASAARIAGGIAASVAVSSGLKLVVGRSRPFEAPDDPDLVAPFSGHTAFPSGHTTVAFSLASGIDRETSARWVPYVVYPLAGVAAWSRIRDNRHWASDVVGGAIVGVWASHKFSVLVGHDRGGKARTLELGVGANPVGPGAAAGATIRF